MFTHLTPPTTHKRWEKTTKTITIIKNKNFINRKCKPGLFFFFAWGVKVQQHTRTRVAEPNLSFYFSELQRQHLFLMYLFLHPSPQFISPALYFFYQLFKKKYWLWLRLADISAVFKFTSYDRLWRDGVTPADSSTCIHHWYVLIHLSNRIVMSRLKPQISMSASCVRSFIVHLKQKRSRLWK